MSDPPKRRAGGPKPADADQAVGTRSPGAGSGDRNEAGADKSKRATQADPHRPLTIGDLARVFDISTRAIRFYEARGLISPHRQGANRVFDRADQQRLALILRTKNLGLSLEEIGEHLALLGAHEAPADALADLKLSAEQQIASLTAKRDDLQATLKDLRRIRAAIEERQKERKTGSRR